MRRATGESNRAAGLEEQAEHADTHRTHKNGLVRVGDVVLTQLARAPSGDIEVFVVERGRASELLLHMVKHTDVSALDLHGVEPTLLKKAEEAAVGSVKRVRTRALDGAAWFDAEATTSPRWHPFQSVTDSLILCPCTSTCCPYVAKLCPHV